MKEESFVVLNGRTYNKMRIRRGGTKDCVIRTVVEKGLTLLV